MKTKGKALYVAPRADRPGICSGWRATSRAARPFDAERLQWTGEPIFLARRDRDHEYQAVRSASGRPDAGGCCCHRHGRPGGKSCRFCPWTGKDGRRLRSTLPRRTRNDAIAIPRDGERAALTASGPGTGDANGDIWLEDFAASARDSRLTLSQDRRDPVSTDGRRSSNSSDRDSRFYRLSGKRPSGTGEEEAPRPSAPPWIPSTGVQRPLHDLTEQMNPNGLDLHAVAGDGDVEPIAAPDSRERSAMPSFSGRQVAVLCTRCSMEQSIEVYGAGLPPRRHDQADRRRLKSTMAAGGPLRFDSREILLPEAIQRAPQRA